MGDGRWEYTDAEGTVTFTTRDDEVTMNVTDGIASFCGAYWPGDRFVRDGWKPPFSCVVTAAKVHFHVVEPPPPGQRYGYVLAGDRVEAAGLVSEGGAPLLARYVGERTTAGSSRAKRLRGGVWHPPRSGPLALAAPSPHLLPEQLPVPGAAAKPGSSARARSGPRRRRGDRRGRGGA